MSTTHGRPYNEPVPEEDFPPLEAERHPKNYQEAFDLLATYADHNELWNQLVIISRRISREFRWVLESDDLLQSWCLNLAEHPNHAKHWLTTDKTTGQRKFGWSSYKRDAAAIMAKAARDAKAKAIGYEPDDEYFYTKAQIQELLPYVFIQPTLVTSDKDPEGRYAAPDHAKGGNHLAGVMDVRGAWDKTVHVGSQWDRIMRGLYQVNGTRVQVAESLGISRQAVEKSHDRCLAAMAECLNGTRPLVLDGPGTRRAQSNATCIARTKGSE